MLRCSTSSFDVIQCKLQNLQTNEGVEKGRENPSGGSGSRFLRVRAGDPAGNSAERGLTRGSLIAAPRRQGSTFVGVRFVVVP
jgi:hypothetical protein